MFRDKRSEACAFRAQHTARYSSSGSIEHDQLAKIKQEHFRVGSFRGPLSREPPSTSTPSPAWSCDSRPCRLRHGGPATTHDDRSGQVMLDAVARPSSFGQRERGVLMDRQRSVPTIASRPRPAIDHVPAGFVEGSLLVARGKTLAIG